MFEKIKNLQSGFQKVSKVEAAKENNLAELNETCTVDLEELNKDYVRKSLVQDLTHIVAKDLLKTKYTKPDSGIPKLDLSQEVLDELEKASTALQPKDVIDLVKKENLANVALSGDFRDLINVPDLPVGPSSINVDTELSTSSTNPVQNKVITLKVEELQNKLNTVFVEVGKKVDLSSIPTKVSQLVNDAKYVKTDELSPVSFSGDFNDLKNKPSGGGTITVDSQLSTTSQYPVQNKVITAALNTKANTSNVQASLNLKANTSDVQTALNNKQDSLNNTVIATINGKSLKYKGSITISSGSGAFIGQGTLAEAKSYADEHTSDNFQWILIQPISGGTVRKVIWHIGTENIFIDAIGAIIN